VGGSLAFLQFGFLTRGGFAWVRIAEQPERPDIRQGIVTHGQLEDGDIRIFSGSDLAQRQHLVDSERRAGNSLVTQNLAEETSLNLWIRYFGSLAFCVNSSQFRDDVLTPRFFLLFMFLSISFPFSSLLLLCLGLLDLESLRFHIGCCPRPYDIGTVKWIQFGILAGCIDC